MIYWVVFELGLCDNVCAKVKYNSLDQIAGDGALMLCYGFHYGELKMRVKYMGNKMKLLARVSLRQDSQEL